MENWKNGTSKKWGKMKIGNFGTNDKMENRMVPYGTTWYRMVPYDTIMVPYGTIWYHKVPRPGWGGTLLGRQEIYWFMTFEKKEHFLYQKIKNIVKTHQI